MISISVEIGKSHQLFVRHHPIQGTTFEELLACMNRNWKACVYNKAEWIKSQISLTLVRY